METASGEPEILSWRGQFEFLRAIQTHWPEFWESLKRDVFDACEYFAVAEQHGFPSPEMKFVVEQRFASWCRSVGIADQWLVSAGHSTLITWAQWGAHRDQWLSNPKFPCFTYYPERSQDHSSGYPAFSPVIVDPYAIATITEAENTEISKDPNLKDMFHAFAPRESIQDFKKRMHDQFERQLSQYARVYQRHVGLGRLVKRDAIMTVLYQRGKSLGEIKLWQGRQPGQKLGLEAIRKAITEFAASIDLKLRLAKAGKTSKRISVTSNNINPR
jgi:hypothetical protein